MKNLSFVAGITLLALFAPGVLAVGQSPAPQKIKVLTLLGRPLPVVVAQEHDIFAKYGVEVETANMSSSDELRANLAAGKGDLGYAAVDNAVAMVELAGDDVAIFMGGEGSQNELIVQPYIKSVKDLRGRVLLVDAVNTAYALQLKKILLLSGLRQDRDYELKPFGATPLRLAALREHKEYAGTMLGPPSSIVAKRAGLVRLATVHELIGPYQGVGLFGSRQWAQEHRQALTRFIAACIEAQRWLMAPVNQSEVIELMSKESHLHPDVAAETYTSLNALPGGYEQDAGFDVQGFENVLHLRAELEGQWSGHPPSPEKYYAPSYYLEALAGLTK